jgi:transcriptional regulator with XRE-family HTH domain
MMKSSVRQPNLRQRSLSAAEGRHNLLLAMAADAEQLHAQAQRIRKLRKDKGRRGGVFISQETAAHGIGVSSRTYRTWEAEGAELKLENLKALAAYYDTVPDYIERGLTHPAPTPDLGKPTQLERIEQAVVAIDEKIERLMLELSDREMAAVELVDKALQRVLDSRDPPQR